MQKAHRGRPLSKAQKVRNRCLAAVRYVVEQTFGTQHRKFGYSRASYFSLEKVAAQSHLKAICLNLLKGVTGSVCLLLPERAGIAWKLGNRERGIGLNLDFLPNWAKNQPKHHVRCFG